mmetsp:Transcript_19249/g.41357  ORF Transcript_19249/g.41357 Transcript_19249/m.41357 type:complete len:232 (+) Transcript_19249:132-827(+)
MLRPLRPLKTITPRRTWAFCPTSPLICVKWTCCSKQETTKDFVWPKIFIPTADTPLLMPIYSLPKIYRTLWTRGMSSLEPALTGEKSQSRSKRVLTKREKGARRFVCCTREMIVIDPASPTRTRRAASWKRVHWKWWARRARWRIPTPRPMISRVTTPFETCRSMPSPNTARMETIMKDITMIFKSMWITSNTPILPIASLRVRLTRCFTPLRAAAFNGTSPAFLNELVGP